MNVCPQNGPNAADNAKRFNCKHSLGVSVDPLLIANLSLRTVANLRKKSLNIRSGKRAGYSMKFLCFSIDLFG